MVIDGILGNGDILHPTGRTAGFGKIDRSALPKHVLLALFDAGYIGFELLIIPQRHRLGKFLVVGK